MAAAERKPLRIDATVDAACVRVHAGMFAERVNVSAVTKMWPASTGRGASTTAVSFILRDFSNRRERRQRRSEARAAAFRARRRFGVAIQDARAAGEEYARELVAFAGLSVEAPPFSPEPRTVAAQEAASVLFRGLYPFLDMRREKGASVESAAGISLERLPAEENAARALQRRWRARRFAVRSRHAVVLQRWFRARRYAMRSRHALVLQRWWRAHRYATKYRHALILQRWWRALRVGVECRSALALQRWWRSRDRHIVRIGMLEAASIASQKKVLTIQSFWRGWQVRRAWRWKGFAGCKSLPSISAVLTFCARFLVPAAAVLSNDAAAAALTGELGRLWLDARLALEGLEDLGGTVWNLEEDLQAAVWAALRALTCTLGTDAQATLFFDIKLAYLTAQRPCSCGTCAVCFRFHRECCRALGYSEQDTEDALRAMVARTVEQKKAAAGAVRSSR